MHIDNVSALMLRVPDLLSIAMVVTVQEQAGLKPLYESQEGPKPSMCALGAVMDAFGR